jgi:hypothetical protein
VNEYDDLDELERELGPTVRLTLHRFAAEITDDGHTSWLGPDGNGPGDLDELMKRSTTVTMIDTEPNRPGPVTRHRRPIVAVAAAVVAIVVGGIVFAIRDDDSDPRVPADTTVVPDATTAEAVARGFVEAYGAFDADRVMTYLADDADITGLTDWYTTEDVQGTRDELRLIIALEQADGYHQVLDSCDEKSSSADGTIVRCTYQFDSLGSDELGLGPFGGSWFDLTVRDGAIARASKGSDESRGSDSWRFSNEVWVPLSDWVLANHPQEAAIVFTSPEANGARLTEEAIPVWEQLIQEYVQLVLARRDAYPGEVGAICATQAARIGELTAPTEGSLDQVAAWDAGAAAILEQAHRELIALVEPPATDTTAYVVFNGQLARLARIMNESAEAATAGDSARLAELNAEYAEVLGAMNAPAGAQGCLSSLSG